MTFVIPLSPCSYDVAGNAIGRRYPPSFAAITAAI